MLLVGKIQEGTSPLSGERTSFSLAMVARLPSGGNKMRLAMMSHVVVPATIRLQQSGSFRGRPQHLVGLSTPAVMDSLAGFLVVNDVLARL